MEMIAWAIRSGHDSGFAATINAYDDSEYSDEEIEEFWKKCGISRVTVIRLESKCDPKKIGKHPFGTCHVRAVKSPRWLYSYYLGQRDALVYTENE